MTAAAATPPPFPLNAVLTELPPHYRPLVRFLAHTRARLIEACALEVGDLDLTTDPPTVAVTKTLHSGAFRLYARVLSDGGRTLTITDRDVAAALATLAGTREPRAPLFPAPDHDPHDDPQPAGERAGGGRGSHIGPSWFVHRVWNPAARAAADAVDLDETPHLHQLYSGRWF